MKHRKKEYSLKESIGIDIGDDSIKISKLRRSGRSFILQNHAIFPTPIGAVKEGEIKEPNLLAEALNECLKDAHIKKGKGVLGISGKDVIVRITELPIMPYKELKDAVGWDLTQYIPYPLEDAIYDFSVLEVKNKEKNGERLKLLVAAAPRKLINQYINILHSVNISLTAVDIEALGLLRVFSIQKPSQEGIYVIIDIGSSNTSIVGLKGNNFIFIRDALVGGMDFTNALVEGLRISQREAENIKRNIDSHPEKDRIYSIINPIMDDFVLEITRSLNYFRESVEDTDIVIDKIFTTGGTMKLKGFLEYLQSGIGIKMEKLDPLVGISSDHKNKSDLINLKELLSVSIGLSKRGMEGD